MPQLGTNLRHQLTLSSPFPSRSAAGVALREASPLYIADRVPDARWREESWRTILVLESCATLLRTSYMTSVPTREPDFELSVLLINKSGQTAKIPARLWLPEHPEDRVALSFTSKDIALFALAHDPCCDLEAAVTGAQKQPQLLIRGTGVYLGDVSAKNISSDEPLIVTGTATADRLAVIRVLPPDKHRRG